MNRYENSRKRAVLEKKGNKENMMNKNMMNNIGLLGIIALIMAVLIACEENSGDTAPLPPSNLYAWGDNGSGQLGDGNGGVGVKSTSPVMIGNSTWKQVSVGSGHTVAIDDGGKLYAWGDNGSGQLGDGNSGVGVKSTSPVKIGNKTWTQVNAGYNHTVAIDTDGYLYAWGDNGKGQLGDGTTNDSNIPIKIGNSTWKQASSGGYVLTPTYISFTMAIDSNDNLYAWGDNSLGQLGTGNTTSSLTPIKIGEDTWKQVSAGYNHTVAIDSNDNLYAWGDNYYGQLGDGNSGVGVKSTSPVMIGNSTWKQVSAGVAYSVAIDSNDNLYAWGANGSGQLGDGNGGVGVTSTSPVKIGNSTWKQASTGYNHTVAIDSNDNLYAWGANGSGQLGIGNATRSLTPIKIGEDTWLQVNAGGDTTLGIIE